MKAMTKQVTTAVATEYTTHQFTSEASTIGLAPGEWPERLTTDLGNGMDLLKTRQVAGEGAVYQQEFGCITLTVFND